MRLILFKYKNGFLSIQIKTESTGIQTEQIELTHTSLETDVKSVDISSDFKSTIIDMSNEYSRPSEVIDVSFEKVKQTVDFGVSVESKLIEVGTETFGEKETVCVDTLTVHEVKANVFEILTEFSCNMTDSESSFERRFIEESWSHCESGKLVEVSSEYRNEIVDFSSEYTYKTSESLVNEEPRTREIGIETTAIGEVVDESCAYELDYSTFDCDTFDIVDEIVPQTEVQEESEMLKVEDEFVCSESKMVDISTTAEAKLVDISGEMKVEHVEFSSEWSKLVKHESESFETETPEMSSTEISSDGLVQYCTVEIEFEETKAKKIESGFETKSIMTETFSDFEVNIIYDFHFCNLLFNT